MKKTMCTMTYEQVYEQCNKYTLNEVYALAEEMGYDVDLWVSDDPEECSSRASFGCEYTEEWFWYFDDLTAPAVEFDYEYWED